MQGNLKYITNIYFEVAGWQVHLPTYVQARRWNLNIVNQIPGINKPNESCFSDSKLTKLVLTFGFDRSKEDAEK